VASTSKQQKRAKRAKDKARQQRIERQKAHTPTPIVPDYFMPDFLEGSDDALLADYFDLEILQGMDAEQLDAIASLMRDEKEGLPTDDEMLLWEVFAAPAPAPSEEQRIAHYEALKVAEQESQHALLVAFAKGPIAAHALHDIDFDDYIDILVNTLGAYWIWAYGLDEESVRAKINNVDFYEAFREALGEIEEEAILRKFAAQRKKPDEAEQD
jgi:hypothetical protein